MSQYVYVASSWRNTYYPGVVEALLAGGIDVYDFRHPAPGNDGFRWSEIDPSWDRWTVEQYAEALKSPIAVDGFSLDKTALMGASALVLVLPCGRSAHVEAGFAAGRFVGRGGRVFVYIPEDEKFEPELMYSLFDGITSDAFRLAEMIGNSADWFRGGARGSRIGVVKESHSYLVPKVMEEEKRGQA